MADVDNVAMGIAFDYQNSVVDMNGTPWAGLPSFLISLSLNILLTLMIVTRLILHTRNTRSALGIGGIGGLCKAIITMLIESCVLFAVSSLLVIGPWSVSSPITNVFLVILPQTQVRVLSRPRSSDGLSHVTTGWPRSSHHCSSFNESPIGVR